MKLDAAKCKDAVTQRLVYKARKGGWMIDDCMALVDYHFDDAGYAAACAEMADEDGKMPSLLDFMVAFLAELGEAQKK